MMTDSVYKEELSESGEAIGIEADHDSESILDPFDPESISIDQKSVPMETLIRRLKQKSINLTPSFQRNEVWNNKNRSRLIESIFLKIPLPMFYVASDEDGNWEVVDGLQRLSTIRDFLLYDNDKELVLKELEFLGGRLDGKTFSQIKDDDSNQRLVNTILETELRFTVINPGTPEAVKRNIFKRINTGGLPLTPQEIRHALYQGQSTDLLIELANSKEFKNAVSGSINDTRMGARELILYFISFLIFARQEYRSNVDDWLSNALQIINLTPELDQKSLQKIYGNKEIPNIRYKSIEKIETNFKVAMSRSKKLFGGHAFRKSLPGDNRKTPINKALFETWSNILCELNDEEFFLLLNNKKKLLSSYKILLRGNDLPRKVDEDMPSDNDAKEANHLNYLFFNELTTWTTSDLFLEISLGTSKEKFLRYQKLIQGNALDDAISRNASDARNVLKRFNLMNNMVSNILKEVKGA